MFPGLPAHLLKRHPIEMEADFGFVLVLTYAFPKAVLIPLLSPGLTLDTFGDLGFLAVAVVETFNMRVRGFPKAISKNYNLIGYRLFVRYRTLRGKNLRGLRIIRSDVNSKSMAITGNLLTHYSFEEAEIEYKREEDFVHLRSNSKDGRSELILIANINTPADYLPPGSPFSSVQEALKFAGPMPFTFDYEEETNSIIRVEGVRQNWHPQPIEVDIEKFTFVHGPMFCDAEPLLCSAFYLQNIPYYWNRGIREVLSSRENHHEK
ncbi:MAG: DUF2071 domain-containing protein [Candidatus Obscuribacterales bacterium]|nr:DUF2071 domain-containing protein [Candidatus Obscuribacterales bacterium]